MKPFTLGRGTLFWLVLFLLLFIGISYFITPDKPKEYPDYAAESPSQTGVKAFYTYLKDEKQDVSRWTHAPELLPENDKPHILLMTSPSFIPDEDAMAHYISFMEEGNTILLLKTNPDGMFGVTTEPLTETNGETVRTDEHTYEAETNEMVRLEPDSDDEVLLEDDAGAIASKKDYGDGALITAISPDWMANENIVEKDHLALLFSLMENTDYDEEAVYFDEYIHGTENAASVTTLYPRWLLITGFQAILWMILLLWYRGKRFGKIMIPREESVRFKDEHTRALAAWYRHGRLYVDAFKLQTDYVKRLLQERWGIPYRQAWNDIAPKIERHITSIAGKEPSSFLNELTNVLDKDHMNKQEYLLWSKRMDTLQKEVEK